MPRENMKVSVKTDRGLVLSQEHGFTVEEADGKVLGFDIIETEEHGTTLLFGDQVFFLKFWDDEKNPNQKVSLHILHPQLLSAFLIYRTHKYRILFHKLKMRRSQHKNYQN